MVAPGSEVVFVGLFFLGVATVVYSVEVFIDAVARSTVSLGVSGFFLAVVLAGVDIENAILGITAAFVDLPELAIGTVFGEALFVLAVATGVAGLVVPFRTEVPTVYLAMLVLVPIPAFVTSIDGTIGWMEGMALTALFVPLLGFIYWNERRSETAYLLSEAVEEAVDLEAADEPARADGPTRTPAGDAPTSVNPDGVGESSDDRRDLDLDVFVPDLSGRSGPFALGVAIAATVGLTAGSLLTVVSAEAIFVALGVSELAFGATVLSFVASIEELALTVEPVRRNRPELAVGNIVGSTVFYVTANAGIIAALHPVATDGAVMTVHWPVFVACLLVVTVTLARGRVTRLGGATLVGLYVVYWIVNYA